jgi:hypothetical protein
MKLYYDKAKAEEITRRIEEKFAEDKHERGDDVHVSDLAGCLMKLFCRLIGLTREESKASVGLMVFGIITEQVIAWTYPEETWQYLSSMNLVTEEEDISGHIDIFELLKFPLEVKGSRKRIFKTQDLPINWVEQLTSYISMQGSDKGWLIIFNILSCQVMAFCMEMTQQDRLDWLITLANRRNKVVGSAKKYKKNKDPEFLTIDIRPKDYTYCAYKKVCLRRDECKKKSRELSKKK